jgi:hypothetical protein
MTTVGGWDMGCSSGRAFLTRRRAIAKVCPRCRKPFEEEAQMKTIARALRRVAVQVA